MTPKAAFLRSRDPSQSRFFMTRTAIAFELLVTMLYLTKQPLTLDAAALLEAARND